MHISLHDVAMTTLTCAVSQFEAYLLLEKLGENFNPNARVLSTPE